MSSLSSKEPILTVANKGREGVGTREEQSKETIVPPWGKILVPPLKGYT